MAKGDVYAFSCKEGAYVEFNARTEVDGAQLDCKRLYHKALTSLNQHFLMEAPTWEPFQIFPLNPCGSSNRKEKAVMDIHPSPTHPRLRKHFA